jgi:hypothetical protein
MRCLILVVTALVCAACASDGADSVDDDSKSDSFGTSITIGGRKVKRIAPVPVLPFNHIGLDAIISGFHAFPVIDHRTKVAADAGLEHTLMDKDGKPIRIGRVAYVRTGLGNIPPSPALVYLLARHFETVVVLYTNMTDSASHTAFGRPSAIGGVPIPESIENEVRIFELGSPQYNMISAAQQSDVLLEQLEILRTKQDQLGFDPLAEPAWIFAHSQGSIDAVISDHRLRREGFAGFEHIITLGGALEGGRLIRTAVGLGWFNTALVVAGPQGGDAISGLAPDVVRSTLVEQLELASEDLLASELEHRIDFAFGGSINLFFPVGNIRPGLWFLASQPDQFGLIGPSDGMVSTDSARVRARGALFNQVDHILLFEDPGLLAGMLDHVLRSEGN